LPYLVSGGLKWYREDKTWTPEEEDKLEALQKQAEKLSQNIIKEIKSVKM